MNGRQLALGTILIGFLGLTAAVLVQHGYLGFFEQVARSSATLLAMVDLSIVLALFAVWMWRDARQHGLWPVPYLIVALLFGAAGPLLYLIVRERRTAPAAAPA